jgi:hypothetical protein
MFCSYFQKESYHMRIATLEKSKLAKSGEEYRTLIASDADWIARTADDLRQLRDANEGSLGKLTQYEFDAFVSSLIFGGGGIASGTYKPLMSSLTITEIFEVFERFGMDRGYALTTLEAKCVQLPDMGHADCEFDFWSFCASNCGDDDIVIFPPG